MTKAYLLGILHDATERKTTFRISQKAKNLLSLLHQVSENVGSNAWIYREGKNREVYIVEFSKSLLNNFEIEPLSDKTEYIRGYFDAEGGIAKELKRQVLSLFCPEKSIRFTKGKKISGRAGI